MKKLIFSSFLLIGFLANAQDFQGKAEYFSKRIMKKKSESTEKSQTDAKNDFTPEMRKQFEEAMKKASEKQFLLTFSKTEAIYEEQQQLEQPEAANGEMSIKVSFSSAGKKYLNLKENQSIVEGNIFGKEFLVVDPLEKPDWKLIDETKNIGDYTCFKAELTIPVSDFQKKEYEEFLKKKKKTALFKMKEPQPKVVTVWYTPEIPVSFGPDNYWGLPGLILEVSDENTVILCSKVTLNSSSKTKIKAPNKGEKMTLKKFQEFRKKKHESMMDEDGVIMFQH